MEVVMLHLYSTAGVKKATNPYLTYEIAGGIIAVLVALSMLTVYNRKRRREKD